MSKELTKEELKKCIKNERNVFLNSFFDLLNQRKELEQKVQRLQEQLNEANEVIKGYSKLESLMNCALGPTENCPSQKYIEKWGVK